MNENVIKNTTQRVRYEFTRQEVVRLIGVNNNDLDYYDRKGMVKPEKKGTIKKYLCYSWEQILELKTIKKLKDVNIPLQTIRKILENLQKKKWSDVKNARAFINVANEAIVKLATIDEDVWATFIDLGGKDRFPCRVNCIILPSAEELEKELLKENDQKHLIDNLETRLDFPFYLPSVAFLKTGKAN